MGVSMGWALDLAAELVPLVRRWQEDFPDYPAPKMISDLGISGLHVNSGAGVGEIAGQIAGFAEGVPGAIDAMVGRIERSRAPDGEGGDLTLEVLLIEHLSTTEWDRI